MQLYYSINAKLVVKICWHHPFLLQNLGRFWGKLHQITMSALDDLNLHHCNVVLLYNDTSHFILSRFQILHIQTRRVTFVFLPAVVYIWCRWRQIVCTSSPLPPVRHLLFPFVPGCRSGWWILGSSPPLGLENSKCLVSFWSLHFPGGEMRCSMHRR